MKAAVLKKWGEMELTQIAIPEIGSGEALIRVRYGGICGSDLAIYCGQHPTAKAPVVLCHEILGIVEQLPGDYAGTLKLGDRVLVNPVISCKKCSACKRGYENICNDLKLIGIHTNGGFAEFVKAPAENLVNAPEELSDEIAALGEPFAVSCHVNRRLGMSKDDRVLVIGAGVIGIVTALGAMQFGAKVYISELNPERLALAASFGIETLAINDADALAAATDGEGFDVVIDSACCASTALMLPDLCRTGGRIASMALSRAEMKFMIGAVSFREQTLVGSRLYHMEDFEAGTKILRQLAQAHDMRKLISDIYTLDEISEGFNYVLGGKNIGKVLIHNKNSDS